MLKFYAAIGAALHTAYLFAHVGVAAGVLALLAYGVACAVVDLAGALARKLRGPSREPRGKP